MLNGVMLGEAGDAERRLLSLIGEHEHLIVAVVDGLGMHLVDRLPADAFLRRHLAIEMRTVFPSSTAPALTSLATGAWPAQHAVMGWWTYLPHAGQTATILPYTERFSERPLRKDEADRAYAAPALMASYASDALSVQPSFIANSVSSRYFSGGRGQRGYDSLNEAVDAIVARAGRGTARTFTYLYVPFVDTAEHEFGPTSGQAWLTMMRVQARLERLAGTLAGRARLIVTADHGQIAVARRTIVTAESPLMRHLRFPPSGEPRVAYVHARDESGGLPEAFHSVTGGDWLLMTAEEAFDSGLFGPEAPSDETRRRVGDYVAIAPPGHVLLYEPSDALLAMSGTHGGLTRDEMRIPLILA